MFGLRSVFPSRIGHLHLLVRIQLGSGSGGLDNDGGTSATSSQGRHLGRYCHRILGFGLPSHQTVQRFNDLDRNRPDIRNVRPGFVPRRHFRFDLRAGDQRQRYRKRRKQIDEKIRQINGVTTHFVYFLNVTYKSIFNYNFFNLIFFKLFQIRL